MPQTKALELTFQRSTLSRLPPLLPPLLLLLKLSQWWYSPSSPRHIAIASTVNDIAKTHAAILPPRPLPILPDVTLHPPPPSAHNGGEDIDGQRTGSPPPPYVEVAQQQGTAEIKQVKYAVDATTYGTCPICGDKWKNPAVLPTGWVVCWRCGWDALEGEGDDDDDVEVVEEAEASSAEGGDVGKAAATGKAEGAGVVQDSQAQPIKRKKVKGRCPITGAPVGRGQLRRVLV